MAIHEEVGLRQEWYVQVAETACQKATAFARIELFILSRHVRGTRNKG